MADSPLPEAPLVSPGSVHGSVDPLHAFHDLQGNSEETNQCPFSSCKKILKLSVGGPTPGIPALRR